MNIGRIGMKVFRGRQQGYNLVEVLVAMAVLGSVILSVVGLFYLGRRNVYSGKQLTFANSIGTQVMEDLSSLTMTSLYAAFVIDDTTTLTSHTVNGIAYPASIVRTTSSISASTEQNPPGFLTRWLTAINSPNRLQDPVVTVIMTPTLPSAVLTSTTPKFPAPAIMRIRVVISWNEGKRSRSITLDTVKTQRS
jgi:prepilin-type N-terminal cleavage/methylation domain-containing protein